MVEEAAGRLVISGVLVDSKRGSKGGTYYWFVVFVNWTVSEVSFR